MTYLHNPTGRKTQAYIVTLDNGLELFFSYQTMIAVRDAVKGKSARLANSWGPTTGRHFNELGCGCFPIVDKMPSITGTTVRWGKEQ